MVAQGQGGEHPELQLAQPEGQAAQRLAGVGGDFPGEGGIEPVQGAALADVAGQHPDHQQQVGQLQSLLADPVAEPEPAQQHAAQKDHGQTE